MTGSSYDFTVTTLSDVTADDGQTTLREAIVAANATGGPSTIGFQSGLTGTIALSQGELLITDSVSIDGGASSR